MKKIIPTVIVIAVVLGGFLYAYLGKSPEVMPVALEYRNDEYGFTFVLPQSWQGYTIVTEEWEGYINEDPSGDKIVTKGPEILIRHPSWTEKVQRQDIPIMVFTLAQWKDLEAGKFWIGAAPVGPSELGRNSKYVFALPARYNYAFPEGYEEVENILAQNPLHPF